MRAPLDELYFTWLYGQVGSVEITDPSVTYWGILKQLYTKEFVWVVPNDDNRLEDGRDLRLEFLVEEKIVPDEDETWMRLGCSMLEMMVGLSRRLSFEAGGESSRWFWQLMKNLKLDECTDDQTIVEREVDNMLDRVIWRTYRRNGLGGLFPLKKSKDDQRGIEIWYQLCAYLLENGY
jgi:hypothetical protein